MLSDKTYERLKRMEERVKDIISIFGCTREVAFVILAADASQKALEVAERIDRRQEQNIEAEVQSLSARASTLRSKMVDKEA